MSQSKVCLELSPDEALVLFDWLCRINDAESQQFEDQAEQRVLWNLEAMLESALPEILHPRYEDLLTAARSRVRDPEE